MKPKSLRFRIILQISFVITCLSVTACNYPPNNTLNVNTGMARLVHTGGSVVAPLGSQPVAGQWQSDITTTTVAPFGSVYSFQGVTSPSTPYNYLASIFGLWPTEYPVTNARMPASWQFEWEHPNTCLDTSAPPYPPLQNPFIETITVDPTNNQVGPAVPLYCFTNTPSNPNFIPTNVYPQFALDNQLPSTLQVAAFTPIQAVSSITNLRVFAMNLSNPSVVTAEAVATDGSSALFPYPTQANGAALPAGAYITTITTDPPGGTQTTNGFEPFYVGHNDTSFPGAYGVAVANPSERVVTTTQTGPITRSGGCNNQHTTVTTVGGTPLVLVTLLTQNALAVGSSTNTLPVGLSPTVVLPFHDRITSITSGTVGSCNQQITTYSGAQSALVVNTGSSNISILNIGQNLYPSGNVSVGGNPVAAVINPAETMAYIANYTDNTVSEVDLNALQQTRVLSVMTHPSSLAFDSNGNLWVGGEGAIMNVNVSNWTIATNSTVSGAITAMNYDISTGLLLVTSSQNGSSANPSITFPPNKAVAYRSVPNVSFSASSNYSVATGQTTTSSFTGDNAPYAASAIASRLAFPAQLAFTPPIYTSANGDIAATVTGTSFTVYVVSTNQILIKGMLPFPARSVALTSNMLYFTMPESNSLVSLPIALQ